MKTVALPGLAALSSGVGPLEGAASIDGDLVAVHCGTSIHEGALLHGQQAVVLTGSTANWHMCFNCPLQCEIVARTITAGRDWEGRQIDNLGFVKHEWLPHIPRDTI